MPAFDPDNHSFPNKYAGSCSLCDARVSEGAGFTQKNPGAGPKWLIACRPCKTGETPTPRLTDLDNRPTFPLTEEQEDVVAKFGEGHSLACQAGAGTGKTSTLVAIAKSTNRLGQYVAFNKAIVIDAAIKFAGTNCSAATAHSLAFRQVGKRYKHRLDTPRQSSGQIAKQLGIDPFYFEVDGETKVIQPFTLAGYVTKTITGFCNSDHGRPTAKFLPKINGLDPVDEEGNKTYHNRDRLKEHLTPAIQAAWADILDVDGFLRFNPDHFLKIWELGVHEDPIIPGDYILFDEAQDASPVLLSVVEQQGKQVVFVGDAQQAIYEWRGAIDALDTVAADATCFLTNSFRFGEAIADVANSILNEIPTAQLRLVGRGAAGVVDACDEPDAVLCRSNAGAISVVLESLSAGLDVHLVGGGGEVERFAKAAKELIETGETNHPELVIFDSWTEVQDYVASDPHGGDLALLVKLIDDNGVDTVLRAVANTVSEEDADLVVSTAHKAKGREWDSVKIYGDFSETRVDDAELRLLYVAATRARLHLDIESCAPILSILGED